jgi:hypothetical protein
VRFAQQAELGQVLFDASGSRLVEVVVSCGVGMAWVRDSGHAPAARQRSMQRGRHGEAG